MLRKLVFKLLFWVCTGLANVLVRLLVGDTFGRAMLNVLTIIPLFWIIVTLAEIMVKYFSVKSFATEDEHERNKKIK